MVKRRSKRKVLSATRFSARKQARLQHDESVYGNDFGVLPSVKASVIPGRVPLGFVCGFPLAGGGELYGGSMFARSAADDTPQGKAIQEVNTKFGSDVLSRVGRETIGIPVCKKKYKPFAFTSTRKNGRTEVTVERMYGCQLHHQHRLNVIEKHGVRKGWQPFGVWSLGKAQDQARAETARLNGEDETDAASMSSDSEPHASSICLNGTCTWKVKSAYDDIYKEIHGESDPEDGWIV